MQAKQQVKVEAAQQAYNQSCEKVTGERVILDMIFNKSFCIQKCSANFLIKKFSALIDFRANFYSVKEYKWVLKYGKRIPWNEVSRDLKSEMLYGFVLPSSAE